jgi:hypothetical protein
MRNILKIKKLANSGICQKLKRNALAGNRTRVASMATTHHTTGPQALSTCPTLSIPYKERPSTLTIKQILNHNSTFLQCIHYSKELILF